MKERPILFNTAMVQAILAGRKTQTRRVMKPQPEETPSDYPKRGHWWPSKNHQHMLHIENEMQQWEGLAGGASPFGDIGDRLWVRETWCMSVNEDGHPINAGGQLCSKDHAELFYRATPSESLEAKWVPSIHMPRWACRIILEITSVRVERLHNISDADAMAEGIMRWTGNDEDRYGINAEYCGFGTAGSWKFCETPIKAFQQLWYSTGGQWNANPWVWVIEYKVLTTNGKVTEVAA